MRLSLALDLHSSGVTPVKWINVFPAAFQVVQSDYLLTTSGGVVSGMFDQAASPNHYAQATGSKQPLLTTGLNGKPGVLGDGVDDSLTSALTIAAPGTTPYTVFLVGRQVSWVINKRIVGPTSSTNGSGSILMRTATPNISMGSTAFANDSTGAPVGQFVALSAFFSNSTSDWLKIGSSGKVTGASAGSTTGTGREIFSSAGSNFSNFEILMLAYVPGDGSALDTVWRSIVNSPAGYGSGNVLV